MNLVNIAFKMFIDVVICGVSADATQWFDDDVFNINAVRKQVLLCNHFHKRYASILIVSVVSDNTIFSPGR